MKGHRERETQTREVEDRKNEQRNQPKTEEREQKTQRN
jgi:hypothetical protein